MPSRSRGGSGRARTVGAVVGAFRAAIDAVMAGQTPPSADLIALTEGQKQTHGAFATKKWR